MGTDFGSSHFQKSWHFGLLLSGNKSLMQSERGYLLLFSTGILHLLILFVSNNRKPYSVSMALLV